MSMIRSLAITGLAALAVWAAPQARAVPLMVTMDAAPADNADTAPTDATDTTSTATAPAQDAQQHAAAHAPVISGTANSIQRCQGT